MVNLNGDIEAMNNQELADTLREIADRIEEGYESGCTNYLGCCWQVEGEEEFDNDY